MRYTFIGASIFCCGIILCYMAAATANISLNEFLDDLPVLVAINFLAAVVAVCTTLIVDTLKNRN